MGALAETQEGNDGRNKEEKTRMSDYCDLTSMSIVGPSELKMAKGPLLLL